MVNQQLIDYVKQQSQRGVSREAITEALVSKGWQQADIEDAFKQISDSSDSSEANQKNSSGGIAIAGLVLGGISLIAWLIPLFGLPIAVVGLILSIVGLKSLKRGVAIGGIILCSVGLVLTIVNASIGAYMGATGQHPIVNKILKEDRSQSGQDEAKDEAKAELIRQGVREVKSQFKMPYKLDQFTTMVDVTAESDAIRYHYVISGLDTKNLTTDLLKQSILTNICTNDSVKFLLDQDINMEYSYSVQGSSQKYFVIVTKSDCK